MPESCSIVLVAALATTTLVGEAEMQGGRTDDNDRGSRLDEEKKLISDLWMGST